MQNAPDPWQICFFGIAALLVAAKAWHGWRLGVVRQSISLVALVCAYLCAIFGGRVLSSVFFLLGVPSGLSGIAGGATLGLIVYLTVSIVGAILFKKTSQQGLAVVRVGYGVAGAAIGGLMGLFVVWIAVLGIRVLGTVAKTQIEASQRPATAARGARPQKPAPQPGPIVHGLARLKDSLERGKTGAVVEHVDPIPGTLYSLLTKVGQMISNEQSIDRFLAYPGVKTLTEHPKIAALHSDPEIAKNLIAQDYFALVRNEQIIRAANDREIGELMTKFEFEKALDYALSKPKTR
jgi:Colicin V production protein